MCGDVIGQMAPVGGGGVVLQTKQFYKILAEHPHTMSKAVEHAREFVCFGWEPVIACQQILGNPK